MIHTEFDVIVVGAGAAGAVFANRLVRAGLQVLLIEKGPHYRQHHSDFQESELAIPKLLWDNNGYRVTGSAFRGTPNLGKAVGGGTLAWTGIALRLFEHDFECANRWGEIRGANIDNWPLRYQDLAPFYTEAEQDMGVSGTATPWDVAGATLPPLPPLDYYRTSRVYQQGFSRLNMQCSAGRVATNSQQYQGRSACLHCGFCRSGCRIDAKYQADTVLISPVLTADNFSLLSETTVTRLLTSADGRRITAVEYVDNHSRQKSVASAKVVVVCNNPIETPRLLLASANAAHPAGIGNQYDLVGRNFFCHLGTIGLGQLGRDVRLAIGHNMGNIMSLDQCNNAGADGLFKGGYTLLSLNGAGAGVAALDPLVQVNGYDLKQAMAAYNESLMLLSFVEGLPVATNRITLVPAETDEFGVPRAKVHYDYHPNDLAALRAAQRKLKLVLKACGARQIRVSPEFEAHPMGTMRMGWDETRSVTNEQTRVHGVENLYIGGGSLFVTGSSVNPTLTIHALALRSCQHILQQHFTRQGDSDADNTAV